VVLDVVLHENRSRKRGRGRRKKAERSCSLTRREYPGDVTGERGSIRQAVSYAPSRAARRGGQTIKVEQVQSQPDHAGRVQALARYVRAPANKSSRHSRCRVQYVMPFSNRRNCAKPFCPARVERGCPNEILQIQTHSNSHVSGVGRGEKGMEGACPNPYGGREGKVGNSSGCGAGVAGGGVGGGGVVGASQAAQRARVPCMAEMGRAW